MGNRMKIPPAYQYLTALCLTFATAARAAACCELPDAGDLSLRGDTGQASAQEAWVDLYVEDVRNVPDPYGGRRMYSTLHVLRKRPLDTSVFFAIVAPPSLPERWITSFDYGADGFPEVLVDSTSNAGFTQGDTLSNVFAARITSTSGRSYLTFGGLQCKLLTPVPGPFPIGDALNALNRFRDSLATAQGQSARPPRVRIGPTFIGVAGDPGLLVRAEASGEAWLIRYQTGSGDCPAGCTEHAEIVYRVSAMGKVEVVSSRHFFAVCWTPDALPPLGRRARSAPGYTGCYTPEGRKLPGIEHPRATVPWIRAP